MNKIQKCLQNQILIQRWQNYKKIYLIMVLSLTKLTTKKSVEAKEKILKHYKTFNGSLNDTEPMKLCNISRNSFYKYKKEVLQDMKTKGEIK